MIRGYVRVSTIEQASEQKTSLADQARIIRGIAMMRGDDEIVIYEDRGVSGSVPLDQREAGARMLNETKSGDIIVVSKMDRLFRSTLDALQTIERLKSQGIKVIIADISNEPVSENGVGKMFFVILAAVADVERERIADRTAAGRAGKKARGGHVGGDVPYGFIKEGAGAQAMLKPNPCERKIIERMTFLHHRNGSYRKVARDLNAEGLHGREGPWFPMQVKRILERQL